MSQNYSDTCLYKDIYVIIQMMNEDLRNKISENFIGFLRENQDEKYESYINPEIPLREQKLNEKTKLMLSMIYIDYLCDDVKKQEILKNEQKNIEEFNIQMNENIFRRKEKIDEQKKELIVVEEKNIIQKIIEKIKKIFRK